MSNLRNKGDYRERIYRSYVQSRDTPLAPTTLSGLKPRLPYLRRLVTRHFPAERDATILELGCGHGILLYVLAEAGYKNARGVDDSPEQVAAAKRLGIEGVTQSDVFSALSSTPPASVDVVITFDLIEHFTKVEIIQLVDAVYRVLKSDGRWIIHVPNAESPMFANVFYGDFTHELGFTRGSLTQLLKSSGFRGIKYFEDRPIPHGPVSAIRAVLWQLIRLGLLFYNAVETGAFDRRAVYSRNLLAIASR